MHPQRAARPCQPDSSFRGVVTMVGSVTSPWQQLAMAVLSVAGTASAAFGMWVAFWYDGGTPVLMPFAIVALVGALACLWGLLRHSAGAVGLGAVVQVLAPTGAAWVGSLIVALCGAAFLIARLVATRRTSGERRPERTQPYPTR